MGKITETRLNDKVGHVKLAGQSIFKQMINLVDKKDLNMKRITLLSKPPSGCLAAILTTIIP